MTKSMPFLKPLDYWKMYHWGEEKDVEQIGIYQPQILIKVVLEGIGGDADQNYILALNLTFAPDG